MSGTKKILLGIYLAVLAILCLELGGDLLYVSLGLALISVLCVLNGFTEKKTTGEKTEMETNNKQE